MTTGSPYSPPTSDLTTNESQFGNPLKGVLIGVLTDVVGTMAISTLLMIGYGALLAKQGVSQDEITALTQEPRLSPVIFWLGYVISAFFSVLGGYVCARIVRRRELVWGAITGIVTTLLGIAYGWPEDKYARLIFVFVLMLGLVLMVGGALLGRWRNRMECVVPTAS